MKTTIKTAKLTRQIVISRAEARGAAGDDDRTVELSFSSEEPYERPFGTEILDHSPGSARLERLQSGNAPLLLDHDRRNQIGVIESAEIGSDRVGRATVRFSKNEPAESVLRDIRDRIRSNVSVGYRVNKMVEEESADGEKVYRVIDHEPLEISIVSIPADPTVGVGRGDIESGEYETEIIHRTISTRASGLKRTETMNQVAEKADRERAAGILAIGVRHNMRDVANEHIAAGTPLADFRHVMLDKIGDAKPIESAPAELGMSEKEVKGYSLVRAIDAAAKQDWRGAEFEREASYAVADRLGTQPNGFFVPRDLDGWSQRDLTVGTATAGGHLKGTDHLGGSFIDALRDRLVTRQLGAQIMSGLVGDIAIPALNAKTTVYWVAENGAPTEGAPTFRQVTMSPKTVAAYVDLSRKLLKQSDPSVEGVVRNDMVRQVANGVDAVAIEGGGSNEPTGITQTSGIGSVAIGTNGGAPTYDSVSSLAKEVGIDNAAMGNLSFLTNEKVAHKLRTTPKVASTDSVMILEQPGSLMGYPLAITNAVPSDLSKGSGSNLSAMIFGNFSDLLIGEWGALDVLVDPYSLSTTGATRVTVFQDVDVAVRHAESFAAVTDYIAA